MSQVQHTENQEEKTETVDTSKSAMSTLPRSDRFRVFLELAVQGQMSTTAALRASGLIEDNTFDVASDEVAVEEAFYERARNKCKDLPNHGIVTDEEFFAANREGRELPKGTISKTTLYKLVDWLYYVRSLPLKAIATAIQIPPTEVARIKADLSNDFANVLHMQKAEGYIGDLLRKKEMIIADINFRKSRIRDVNSTVLIQLDRLLWEIENKFIDRLQEIGIIDKTLGRVEVDEEWHVTIGPAGQPVNKKLDALPSGDAPSEFTLHQNSDGSFSSEGPEAEPLNGDGGLPGSGKAVASNADRNPAQGETEPLASKTPERVTAAWKPQLRPTIHVGSVEDLMDGGGA